MSSPKGEPDVAPFVDGCSYDVVCTDALHVLKQHRATLQVCDAWRSWCAARPSDAASAADRLQSFDFLARVGPKAVAAPAPAFGPRGLLRVVARRTVASSAAEKAEVARQRRAENLARHNHAAKTFALGGIVLNFYWDENSGDLRLSFGIVREVNAAQTRIKVEWYVPDPPVHDADAFAGKTRYAIPSDAGASRTTVMDADELTTGVVLTSSGKVSKAAGGENLRYFQRAVKDAIRQHTPADAVDTSEDGSESDDVDAPVPPRDPRPKRACAKAAQRPVPEPSSAGESSAGESSDSDESSVAPPLSQLPCAPAPGARGGAAS